MPRKVLVANRGVIACRIIRTLDRLAIPSVAVYSEPDRHSPHVERATESYLVGPAPASQSYLRADNILDAARRSGADAIHPGYGFLSENADFAESCGREGIAFIGPTPSQMRAFGLKHTAREMARACGVPLIPGTPLISGATAALQAALQIGFPIMVKSTAGGGGIGMRLCREPSEIEAAFKSVERLGEKSFNQSGTYLEKYVENARHIEVQVFGDGLGEVIALGERDCSVQRRNQKVIEETPAPGISGHTRRALADAATSLLRSVNYRSAGTVEFIYDQRDEQFYFLEVNTRLQVEHGVTEEVCNIDLVEWMIRLAAGDLPPLEQLQPHAQGASIQVRVYAEDPANNFQPSSGILTQAGFPTQDARIETYVRPGAEITPFYDPLLAKIIVHAPTRAAALQKLQHALDSTAIAGIETNLAYLRTIAADPQFVTGGVTTAYLDSLSYQPCTVEVIDGGTFSTIQDYPGRTGFWSVGVPPSGPMDSLAFRFGNRILGNDSAAAGLECTVLGPTLRFRVDTAIAITGADMGATLDGHPLPLWTAIPVHSGSILELREIRGMGARTYILFHGGLDVPKYLGSAATFTLGRFGGHGGRTLSTGDVLHLGHAAAGIIVSADPVIPEYTNAWRIGVLYGPHGAPDFFAPSDIDQFFAVDWKVHYNSSRTGVRLIGPKPQWARADGGEAGLHPSNIHDNAYAIGTIDFTGDMPVILGPDGPSLGGFVCPATIVSAELWKIGQLRPGDTVRFVPLTHAEASAMELQLEEAIESPPTALPELPVRSTPPESPVIYRVDANDDSPAIVCRQSGDKYLLIEYGEPVLDLELRFRIHAIMESIERRQVPGIIDITPGIRSIQIHYDSRWLPRESVLELIDDAEAALPPYEDLTVGSRIVHLPLSWDDPATRLAIEKYQRSVRPDAPWCPSNIEFIRRINGLDSQDDVRKMVFDASYLVLGLGDVYLGAPVATPLDPRHRLVTTKYNPARTWTPENAVGIGGAYLCVYGMEGPGGYQFVGRTVQMWNTYGSTPWLLRFFDQIRFYPVTAGELLKLRDDFPQGKFRLSIEDQPFSVRRYREFLTGIAPGAKRFKARQQAAFEAERQRWAESGQKEIDPVEPPPIESFERTIPAGLRAVRSPAHASLWNIYVKAGDRVAAGARLLILEAMKMEIAVNTPVAGTVVDVLCESGTLVIAGEPLLLIRPE